MIMRTDAQVSHGCGLMRQAWGEVGDIVDLVLKGGYTRDRNHVVFAAYRI